MPRRTQVAKTQPKRKRSTQVRLTVEKLLARKVPKGVVTAAEAIKDPNSGLARAVARIGEQSSGLAKLVARTGEQIAASFEPFMGMLRSQDRLMQQIAEVVVQVHRDLEEVAPGCVEPDGSFNWTKYEDRARIRLGLRSDELWAMPTHRIVALYREKVSYDKEQREAAREDAREAAQEVMRYMAARLGFENVAAVLDGKPEQLGVRIRRLRMQRKWTQDVLGQKMGVSGKTVARWERGEYTPTALHHNCLADLFGISLEALVNGGPASKMSVTSS